MTKDELEEVRAVTHRIVDQIFDLAKIEDGKVVDKLRLEQKRDFVRDDAGRAWVDGERLQLSLVYNEPLNPENNKHR